MKKSPLSSNSFLPWILASLTILTAQNAGQAQTFQDTTFSAGWSDALLPNSTSSIKTCTATQDTSNGSSAPSRTTTHTYNAGQIYCAHLYAPSTYNPASQGQIGNLSYSYDLRHYTSTLGKVGYSLSIFQNNTYYWRTPYDPAGPNTWMPFSGSNLTAASFTKLVGPSANVNPDFSCTGSPIVFGYITFNSQPNQGAPVTTKSGIDNWNVTICQTPCCASQPPNMVGWWQLDEQNGATVVNDKAGFNNQGIPKPGGQLGTGGPSSVTGEIHGALYFAGSYLEVAPQPELDFGPGDFSIDAWVKPVDCSHGGVGHFSGIVDKFNGTTGFSFYLDQPAVGVARLYLKINGSPAFVSTGTIPVLSAATWSHVAVTVARPSNGSLVGTFYINGLPAGTFTPPAASVNNTFPMWIGKTRIPGGICENAIDELELFNRALSPAEVKSIADAKSAGKCP
ncbi:MAG TPA: LamG domain-containing protein [Chthoniobacterales bacterium]|nr:LamG domain-containing protein [Chthoniobacterales bacterium]